MRMLTPDQIAEALQVRPRLLYDWRSRGEGPPWVKIGRLVRYDERGFLDWIADAGASGAAGAPAPESPRSSASKGSGSS